MASTLYVIIADDDDSIRGLIARVVARTYPAVTMSVVTNGLDALLIYDQQGADLLITNNDMPGLRGLSLVEALRVLRSASLPILMISADRTIEERALALGVNLFLVKPFTLAQLAGALTKLLPL
jgi:two-component system, chemotaxis family, chemotaxis protein CheY